MRRILIALILIGAVGAGAFQASQAFFSDTETSKNNILKAGALDLKIDNASYYNGKVSPSTSWKLDDLTNQLFFDFDDIKPSDWGEDTISLHVNDNNAWACMDVKLTKNIDNTCTEPELLDDSTCTAGPEATGSGELAQNVNFVWWGDDGDNVLETGEKVFKEGSSSAILTGDSWTIADSTGNVWDQTSDPLTGAKTYYIGKAWCFGSLTKAPIPAGQGVDPTVASGILCDGSTLDNATQTDILMADVNFSAVQSRNNSGFVCGENPNPTPTPNPTPGLCEKKPDVMLVLDRSGSINATELATLKTASKAFVDALSPNTNTAHVGMASFATNATLDKHLTANGTDVKTGIDALTTGGFTNLFEGLSLADNELANPGDGHDRTDVSSPDFVVVVTDGEPNRPLPSNTANTVAAAEADDLRAHGVSVYVVGIGVTPANETFLKTDIADDEDHYFAASDFDDLQAILQEIANCPEKTR